MSALFVCPFCDENVPNLSVHYALNCKKLWPKGNLMTEITIIHLVAKKHTSGHKDTLCGQFLYDPGYDRTTPHLSGVTCKICKGLIEKNVRPSKV